MSDSSGLKTGFSPTGTWRAIQIALWVRHGQISTPSIEPKIGNSSAVRQSKPANSPFTHIAMPPSDLLVTSESWVAMWQPRRPEAAFPRLLREKSDHAGSVPERETLRVGPEITRCFLKLRESEPVVSRVHCPHRLHCAVDINIRLYWMDIERRPLGSCQHVRDFRVTRSANSSDLTRILRR
jgi:hypothetical protein